MKAFSAVLLSFLISQTAFAAGDLTAFDMAMFARLHADQVEAQRKAAVPEKLLKFGRDLCGLPPSRAHKLIGRSPDDTWFCKTDGGVIAQADRYGRVWFLYKYGAATAIVDQKDYNGACGFLQTPVGTSLCDL